LDSRACTAGEPIKSPHARMYGYGLHEYEIRQNTKQTSNLEYKIPSNTPSVQRPSVERDEHIRSTEDEHLQSINTRTYIIVVYKDELETDSQNRFTRQDVSFSCQTHD
jgi:predicted GNAT superfamily acetyltransferase